MDDVGMTGRGKRGRGGQPGNQNARVHGRYSRLRPSDRHAELRRALQSYGLKQTPGDVHGKLARLLDDPNTPEELVAAFLEVFAAYTVVTEELHRLKRRRRS